MTDEETKKRIKESLGVDLEELIDPGINVSTVSTDQQIDACENVIEGTLVSAVEDLIKDNTPTVIHGGMTIAIVMASIVGKYMSSGSVKASEHNINQLCRVAKSLAKNLIEAEAAKEQTDEKPPEGYVLN